MTLPLHTQPFAGPLAQYLEALWKARQVGERFSVNPAWSVKTFDQDAHETAEQLYAIFFGTGWSQPMPHVRLAAKCVPKTFRHDMAKQIAKPGSVRITSDCIYSFIGEKIEVGRLVHDYTEMSVQVKKKKAPARVRRGKGRGKKTKGRAANDTLEAALVGTETTVMSVRAARPEDG